MEQAVVVGVVGADLAEPAHRGAVELQLVDRLAGADAAHGADESDRRNGAIGYEVESEQGHDIRRELARTIVTNGWGLMELRPMRMSLEEIFVANVMYHRELRGS